MECKGAEITGWMDNQVRRGGARPPTSMTPMGSEMEMTTDDTPTERRYMSADQCAAITSGHEQLRLKLAESAAKRRMKHSLTFNENDYMKKEPTYGKPAQTARFNLRWLIQMLDLLRSVDAEYVNLTIENDRAVKITATAPDIVLEGKEREIRMYLAPRIEP